MVQDMGTSEASRNNGEMKNRYLSPFSGASSAEAQSASETSSLSDSQETLESDIEQANKRGIKRLSSEGTEGRNTRARTLLTPEQSRVLHDLLQKTWFPSTQVREAVAAQLGLSPRKVQVFFQNKRQKHRKKAVNAVSTSSHAVVVPPFKINDSTAAVTSGASHTIPSPLSAPLAQEPSERTSPAPASSIGALASFGPRDGTQVASATRDRAPRTLRECDQSIVGYPPTTSMRRVGAYADTQDCKAHRTYSHIKPYSRDYSRPSSCYYNKYTLPTTGKSACLPPIVNSHVQNMPQRLPSITELISPSNLR